MSTNLKFKEEIITTITQLELKKKGSASPSNILIGLEDVVLKNLSLLSKEPTFDLNRFKSSWNKRILTFGADYNVSKKKISDKVWKKTLEKAHTTIAQEEGGAHHPVHTIKTDRSEASESSFSGKSSTSSLFYQQKLSTEDYSLLKENHSRIHQKWVLKSGTIVEDKIYTTSSNFVYEHPAHSYILFPDDKVWKNIFTKEELGEVKNESNHDEFHRELPKELLNALKKLDKKQTFKEFYDVINTIEADRYKDLELYWVKESILNFIDLFHNNNTIAMHTERDLLDEVYGFIKKSRNISETRTESTSSSIASSVSKNKERLLGSRSMIARQACGDHADLVFMHNSMEVGCVEVGLDDRGPNATKELNERLFKAPRMMKAFHDRILEDFPAAKQEKIKTVGFIISGMHITALTMVFHRGSVSLLSVSKRLSMPETIQQVPALLPPVLTLVYNSAKIIKDTVEVLKNVSSSVVLTSSSCSDFFPPCFVPFSNYKRKRKSLTF